jgi:hypothetical protein
MATQHSRHCCNSARFSRNQRTSASCGLLKCQRSSDDETDQREATNEHNDVFREGSKSLGSGSGPSVCCYDDRGTVVASLVDNHSGSTSCTSSNQLLPFQYYFHIKHVCVCHSANRLLNLITGERKATYVCARVMYKGLQCIDKKLK